MTNFPQFPLEVERSMVSALELLCNSYNLIEDADLFEKVALKIIELARAEVTDRDEIYIRVVNDLKLDG